MKTPHRPAARPDDPASPVLVVRSQVSAGARPLNRCEALRARTAVRTGKLAANRCEALRVRTAVRAGRLAANRCEVLAG